MLRSDYVFFGFSNISIVLFSLSQEYQLCRTNGDVERPGGDQLTKSNNEAIDITQSKEGTYTLSWINLFLYYKIFFIYY